MWTIYDCYTITIYVDGTPQKHWNWLRCPHEPDQSEDNATYEIGLRVCTTK